MVSEGKLGELTAPGQQHSAPRWLHPPPRGGRGNCTDCWSPALPKNLRLGPPPLTVLSLDLPTLSLSTAYPSQEHGVSSLHFP